MVRSIDFGRTNPGGIHSDGGGATSFSQGAFKTHENGKSVFSSGCSFEDGASQTDCESIVVGGGVMAGFAKRLTYSGKVYSLVDIFTQRTHAVEEGKRLEKDGSKVVVFPRGGEFAVYAFILRKNPKGEVDSVSARELELYIENNADLYRQMFTPIVNNLLRKMKKGTYHPVLAEKGWLYLVDEGARRYNKEFGDGSSSLKLFNLDTRKDVARRFARSFEAEVKREGIEDRQSQYGINPKRQKKNPPLMVIGNPRKKKLTRRTPPKRKGICENPPDSLMSDSVTEVRYIHRGDGEAYKHSFKRGVRMVAEDDGSISMYHPTKRIHEEFPE